MIAPGEKFAAEKNTQAASWLRRKTLESWSEADEAALNAWLEDDIANRVAYWRLKAAWGRADRLAALRRDKTASHADSKIPSRVLKIAAGVALIAISGAVGNFWLRNSQQQTNDAVYATALGERKTIALTDGSEIELNTNTAIRFHSAAAEKVVTLLRGEAYFQIKHDPSREFVVLAGTRRIVDIGTKFVVRRDGDKLEVSLLEGRARLEAPNDADGPKVIELEPGDMAIAKANQTTLWKKPVAAIADTLAWRKGLLVFDETPLADVAAEFNRYNRKKLIVVGDAARKLAIGGHFQADNVETFARVAEGTLGLHVENKPDEIIITR